MNKKTQSNIDIEGNTNRNQRLIIILFGFVLYAATLTFDFALDDLLVITGNKFTQQGFGGIKSIFTHDTFEGFFGDSGQVAGGRYRPFSQLIFAIGVAIFGNNAFVGHLFAIISYIVLLLVIFSFLKNLFPSPEDKKSRILSIPLVATIFFAAHPLHTEVVANIKSCDETIAMAGSVAALSLLFDYTKKRKKSLLLWASAIYTIALFSKETAITWLAVLPIVLWIFTETKKRDYFACMLALIIPILFFLIVRAKITGGVLNSDIPPELMNNPFINSTKSQEIATVIFTWLMYFKLIIFPHPLTHDYYPKQIEITNFANPFVWLSVIIVVFSIYFFFKTIKNKSPIALFIIIFWATFSISSNILFNIGTFMNERFVFAPLLGIALIAAYFFNIYYKKKRWLKYAFFILIALYSIKTINRSFAWKNNETLFLTDVKTSTKSAKVNVAAAEIMLDKADNETNKNKIVSLANQSLKYLEKAKEIYPDYFGVYDLSGKAYFALGDYKKSLQNYKQCLAQDISKPILFTNIFAVGQAALKTGQYTTSIDAFKTLIPYQRDSAKVWFQIAFAYDQLGMSEQCFNYLDSTLRVDSNYAPAWNKLGEMRGRLYGDLIQAEIYLQRAYSLDKNNSSILENLGVLYGLKKDYKKSILYLRKALENEPTKKQIMNNLSTSYTLIGKQDSAAFFKDLSNKQSNKN